jgi:hypothetical protein
MQIKLSYEDYAKCDDFANNVNTSFYATRNQFSAEKRILDSKIGKLGELTSYYALKEIYKDISYPDFKIYKAREKSWDYDMKSSLYNFHIKTQDINKSKLYGESWIFQLEDKHVFKEYKDNDYVVFVQLDLKNKIGEIRNIVSVKSLHDLKLFKKPVLAKLASKAAVYYEDIKTIKNELIKEIEQC